MVVAANEFPKNFATAALLQAQRIYRPIWRAINQWIDADGMRMSAAMSFYGILSLAPLLVLLVAVLGWWSIKAIWKPTSSARFRA